MASERESVEVSAKTVEEAIERGLGELGLTRDQVEVEVVHPGRSGVLGIGAEDALVRIVALPVKDATEAQPAHLSPWPDRSPAPLFRRVCAPAQHPADRTSMDSNHVALYAGPAFAYHADRLLVISFIPPGTTR